MASDQMLARVQKYHPGDSYKLVEKAYRFAEEAHAGQRAQERRAMLHAPLLRGQYVLTPNWLIDAATIAAG